jgi:hypothetical protein
MGSACVCAQGSPTSRLVSPGGTLRTAPPVLPALPRCGPSACSAAGCPCWPTAWCPDRGVLTTVAALRESSIVVAAIIGSVAFHKRFGWARVPAAACVTAGIAVLYLA